VPATPLVFTVTVTVALDPITSQYQPVQPLRLLDTRNGTGYSGDKPVADQTIRLHITDTHADAAVMNVTGTDATAPGYVTVWPCDQPRPTASNLNLTTGATLPNAVITKLDPSGDACLYTQSGTHLLADLTGLFPHA
jgi:hypothetical protein